MNTKEFLLHEEEHHDRVAEGYSLRRETDFIWEVPEQIFLLKKKYFAKGSIIIDMGCGPSTPIRNSFSAKWLSQLKYIGVDISKEMLRIAKKNIPSGEYKQADVQTVSFARHYANVIISLGTLHHALDKKKTLEHWIKILKKGGYMLLREPTFASLKHGEGESPHEEGIKIDELPEFIKKKGMKIIRLSYFNTQFFHLFNRVMIKLRWKTWEGYTPLGYMIIKIDMFLAILFGNYMPFFRGNDIILIIKKV